MEKFKRSKSVLTSVLANKNSSVKLIDSKINRNKTFENKNKVNNNLNKKCLIKNNNCNTNSTKNNFPIKRKYSKISQESIIDKSKFNITKSKIEDIFRKYSNPENSFSKFNNCKILNKSWKIVFQEFFENERIIDFSCTSFIPKSLNNIGSYVLELEKFWVLWIEIIKKE